MFLVIRFLQGSAAGLISSSALTWLADCLVKRSTLLASACSTGAPSLGFAIGATVIGIFLERPTDVYAILQAMEIAVMLSIVAVLCAEDSVKDSQIKLKEVIKPHLKFIYDTQIGLLPVSIVFAVCWSVSSLVQGFAAAFCEALFSAESAATASSILFGVFIVCNALGTLIGTKRSVKKLQLFFGVFFISALTVLLAFNFRWVAVFYIFAALTGALLGLATSLAMQLLLADASPKDRAGLIGSCCFAGYVGAATTGLVAGWFATFEPLEVLNMAYLCAIGVLWFIAQLLLFCSGRQIKSRL